MTFPFVYWKWVEPSYTEVKQTFSFSIPLFGYIFTIEVTLLLNFTNRSNAGRKYQEDMDVN